MFEEIALELSKSKIIPVIKTEDAETALDLCNALSLGGIKCAEFTFRTENGEQGYRNISNCISQVCQKYPDFLVGAGTVINVQLAQMAQEAGAKFIVSPGFNPHTVDYCISQNLPVFPGVSTAGEIELALEKGLSFLKFFPAQASGGIEFIKAFAGPFPSVKFIATGGVNGENVQDYLGCKNMLAVGGSWMVKSELLKEKNFAEITRLTKEAMDKCTPKAESGEKALRETAVRPEKALYLIPVTLGETPWQKVLPGYNKEIISQIRHFIVENTKSAIRFLKYIDRDMDISACTFLELNEHTELNTIGNYLDPLKKGFPMGVISEAGCPAVADPGAAVVEMAQKRNLRVIPLVGPSSMIMAVMGSGFNGQSFAFNGYLPVKPNERTSKIHLLENRVYKEDQTQLFIEAPYRNLKMFESLLQNLRKDTRLCIAAGITTDQEFIKTKTVEEWKKSPAPDIHKVPAIFLIYK